MIKLWRIQLARRVVGMRENKTVYRLLIGKPGGKITVLETGRVWTE
jgi:hypothetical protein